MLSSEPMVKVMQISVSLICIVVFLAICFYIGITDTSAIQRYRDHHEIQKTSPDDKTSRIAFIQRRIFDNTVAVTTEKASNVNANQSSTSSFKSTISRSSAIQRYRDLHEFGKTKLRNEKILKGNNIKKNNKDDDIDVEKISSNAKTMTSSLFWNVIRFPSEVEPSLPTIISDDYPTNESSTTMSTSSTATFPTIPSETLFPQSSTEEPIELRTTTVLPSSIYTRKFSSQILSCSTTCGGCLEITPTSGAIMSPNYPEHYYSHTDIGYRYCHYNINAPAGKRIHLVFQELNLAFTDLGDFLEVVDKSPNNYGKVLAIFNAGDEAVPTTTTGESMLVFFEGNRSGYTKNGKPPAWKASYYVVEN